MSFYVDTSVLVSALTREEGTERSQRWLAGADPNQLQVSQWTLTEVSSALSMKVRTSQIEEEHRRAAQGALHDLLFNSFVVLPVPDEAFTRASAFLENSALGLRAADALHLAIAAGAGSTIVTCDRSMHASALALGLASELI